MDYLHSYVNYHVNVKTKHFLLWKFTTFKYHSGQFIHGLDPYFRSRETIFRDLSGTQREELASVFRMFGRKKVWKISLRRLMELISSLSQEFVIYSLK